MVLLQETHSTAEDELIWSNEWGRKIVFNHGTSSSKGVALLLDKNNPIKIETVRCDEEGRYMILDLNLEGFKFILVNVYAPNEDNPLFFSRLFENVESRQNDSMILAGDFNTSMDPHLDLFSNKGTNHVKKREVISQFLSDKDLTDIWRVKHPDSKTFSWRKPDSNELVMSRLDHFFVSQDFVARTNLTEIKPKYKSDHSRIVLNLDFSEHKRGKGFWKINNKHLLDKEFVTIVNTTILKYLYNVKSEE